MLKLEDELYLPSYNLSLATGNHSFYCKFSSVCLNELIQRIKKNITIIITLTVNCDYTQRVGINGFEVSDCKIDLLHDTSDTIAFSSYKLNISVFHKRRSLSFAIYINCFFFCMYSINVNLLTSAC